MVRGLEAAIEDLIRLDRHEKRAAPRQRRAIFAFMNLKRVGAAKRSAVEFDGTAHILGVGLRQIGVHLFRGCQLLCGA